jgi:hypothetical protein
MQHICSRNDLTPLAARDLRLVAAAGAPSAPETSADPISSTRHITVALAGGAAVYDTPS